MSHSSPPGWNSNESYGRLHSSDSESIVMPDVDEEAFLLDSSVNPVDDQHATHSQNKRQSVVQPLPPGAMFPRNSVYSLPNRHSIQEFDGVEENDSTSPLGSPSAKLLHTPSPSTAQFASYPPDMKTQPWNIGNVPTLSPVPEDRKGQKQSWTPIPLRPWFWAGLLFDMIMVAVGLELALYFNTKSLGWPTLGVFTTEYGIMHFIYVLPPVSVAALFATVWVWTDIEIQRLQPYVDLVHGNASAKSSLLLDYTRMNRFVVWSKAASNKHYLVTVSSLMALMTLGFQPLAAALFTVRNTWLALPDTTVNSLATIGLNQNSQFQDLTSFLTAAGYASASVSYSLGDSSFIHDTYTVPPFQLPMEITSNGTVSANTTAIESSAGCNPADSMDTQQISDGSGWTNNATYRGCQFNWQVENNVTSLFGTSVLTDCGGSASATPEEFSPIVFWFFTSEPTPTSSITFCNASISLWNVNALVDLASGNLTQVTRLSPFEPGQANFSSSSGNVTGPPLNGRAYNGIGFNLSSPSQVVLARVSAIQLQMPAAVFEAAENSAEGLAAVFSTGKFVELSTQVYMTYLQLIARSIYFLPAQEPITVCVQTFQERLWLSNVAVHLLTVSVLILALVGTIVQFCHHSQRRDLHLKHKPGTIAFAVSIGAQTGLGNLLAGRQGEEDIHRLLQGRKFRIDTRAMKIVMEGEEGYDEATSPDPRRSIGSILGLKTNRWSRRFSRSMVPPVPLSARSADVES